MFDKRGRQTTIVVAYPICHPPDKFIKNTLGKYGVKIVHYKCYCVGMDGSRTNSIFEHGAFFRAEVTVNDSQAEWAEYILLRTHKFKLLSPPINPSNARWAAQYKGMPVPWNEETGKLKRWKQKACTGECAVGDFLAKAKKKKRPAQHGGQEQKRQPRRNRTRRRRKGRDA